MEDKLTTYTENLVSIYENNYESIKDIMKQNDVSLNDLGKKIGVSKQSVFKYFKNNNMGIETLIKVLNNLQLLIEERKFKG